MILTRTKSEFLSFMRSSGASLPEYRIESGTTVYLPFCASKSAQPVFTCGKSFEMLHETNPGKRHTVTVMLSRVNDTAEPEFHVVCGDTFLAGANDGGSIEANNRIVKALAHSGLEGAAAVTAKKLMADCHGRFTSDSKCSFWRNLAKDNAAVGCKHCAGLFHDLVSKGGADETLSEIEAAYAKPFSGKMRCVRGSDGSEALIEELRRLAGPSRSRKDPILIEGPGGFGKTVAARVFGERDFEFCVEVQGSAGLEQFDFLGGNLSLGGGQTVWMDGPVTEAFRLAQSGKKTLLLIDEVYRVPRRERSIFLSALSPHNGSYRLRTGRPLPRGDGTATTEFISAPVENLTIVGTTNSGDDYDVETDDPAAYERWLVILHDPGASFVESILRKHTSERGFSESVITKLMKFRANCAKLKADRECKHVPSPRLLARAIRLSETEGDIADMVAMMIPALVGRAPDGRAIWEQREAVEKAHAQAFGR